MASGSRIDSSFGPEWFSVCTRGRNTWSRARRTYANDISVSLVESLQPVVPVPAQSQEAPPDLGRLAPERSRVA